MSNDFFQDLDKHQSPRKIKNKEVLFQQGDNSRGIYCIKSGKIKLYKSDIDGHQKIIHIAGPGDMIGHRSMLAHEPYLATAECMEEGEAYFVEKNQFEKMLDENSKWVKETLETLAKKLGQSQANELNLAHKNIDQRFADLLVTLSKKYGIKDGESTLIDLSLTRQEIADLMGSTQESAIRIISFFKKLGIITVDAKKITIIDDQKLHEIAFDSVDLS